MGSRRSGKARAPPLEAGFSQLHWMRLTADDQTLGVGLADPDQLEQGSARAWSLEEVRRHNSRHDCWMALRGRVYNVTAYLRYHPGSIEELMRCAGDDGTALFDEAHAYVNVEAILEGCCIGLLAPPAPMPQPKPGTGAADVRQPLKTDAWTRFWLLSASVAGVDSVLLRFGLPDGQRLGLALGEHLQIRVRGPKGIELHRAYTPVSGHKAAGYFELLVFRVEGGIASPLLFEYARPQRGGRKTDEPDDTLMQLSIEARGPRGSPVFGAYGASKLRLPSRASLCGGSGVFSISEIGFATAGSGITPAVSLIRSMLSLHAIGAKGLPALTLVHACQSVLHIPLLAELLEAVRALPALRLFVVCSGAIYDERQTVTTASTALPLPSSRALDELLELEATAAADDTHRVKEAAESVLASAATSTTGGAVRVAQGRRLDAELLARWMPGAAESTATLVCGPSLFNRDVCGWLANAGYAQSNTHVF